MIIPVVIPLFIESQYPVCIEKVVGLYMLHSLGIPQRTQEGSARALFSSPKCSVLMLMDYRSK